MKLDKICEALSETTVLGTGIFSGCAVGQLFYACGKTNQQMRAEYLSGYSEMFDELLLKEYGLECEEVREMFKLNDESREETFSNRHKRVLAHYE